MDAFTRRLRRELPRWVAQGWITAEAGPQILADLDRRKTQRGGGLPLILGAILIGIGVILFIASNWDEIGRFTKIALICAVLATTHLLAGLAAARGMSRMAHALWLLTALEFGGAVMLIGQIYHLPPNPPGFMLIWTLGALATAALSLSQPVAVLGLALSLIWVWTAGGDNFSPLKEIFWEWIPVAAMMTALAYWRRWSLTLWLLPAAFFFWWQVGVLAPLYWNDAGSYIASLAMGAALLCLSVFLPGLDGFSRALRVWSAAFLALSANLFAWPDLFEPAPLAALDWLFLTIGAVFALSAAWRMAEPKWVWALPMLAIATIALYALVDYGPWLVLANIALIAGLLLTSMLGYRNGDAVIAYIGMGGLGLVLVRLYFTTFWTLWDRSLFFLGGGLLLLILGGAVELGRRRMQRQEAGT